ncbi:hypothetical protein M2451_003593 [Dysgonomonas sp. PFB1-18]|uniref:hypothetical protein n=1 Tax=unclassified Dysgonomonas TaxID=2630389 RepID=UPI002473660A|nr:MULTISPECIES: hypothetical protein [unclassified Dysgonomonas]MDH6310791.1 hypothetical protein [Dysgonomonas sp. PF1-14]MDH6340641.1 hypothetical protein [Dysgonomonas sp. PF1-16]MDH6382252.1 hypothetical protein [Dysgonomonas sp. PFB1-18]MDH6399611.1 hypothetical protein [Dysgonomonas sp. PF1-23]
MKKWGIVLVAAATVLALASAILIFFFDHDVIGLISGASALALTGASLIIRSKKKQGKAK